MLRRYYELIVENRFPIVLTSPSKNAREVVNISYLNGVLIIQRQTEFIPVDKGENKYSLDGVLTVC
jgi:hypothetical protein